MRAAIVREYGAPPVLGDHADPTASSGQALVEVTAAPVVPLDLLCASGASYLTSIPTSDRCDSSSSNSSSTSSPSHSSSVSPMKS